MPFIHALKSVLTVVREAVRPMPRHEAPGTSDGEVSTDSTGSETLQISGPGSDGSNGFSKVDIVVETGLMPEEYIRDMISSHGGKLKQKQIVDEAGWSKATVSHLLREMEDEGIITRISLGREKLVILRDDGFVAGDALSVTSDDTMDDDAAVSKT